MSRTRILLILLVCCIALPSAGRGQADGPYLYVLGVVQDAGYPQAACYHPHCLPGWEDARLRRGATSIAVVDPVTESNYLFEATPQLPQQLYWLREETGQESLAGVFLTHAHIGHYAGLMFFGREAIGASAVPVYAMPRMAAFLRANGPWGQLVELGNIVLRPLQDAEPVPLRDIAVTPFMVPHRDEYSETVGYRIAGPNRTAIFIPDINKWNIWDVDIATLVQSVDYALVDATFYDDQELPGRDMSQIPHPFVTESIELFADLPEAERRKVWFIHMNHTNPLLNSDSTEAGYVRAQGFNIAEEGVRLPL